MEETISKADLLKDINEPIILNPEDVINSNNIDFKQVRSRS